MRLLLSSLTVWIVLLNWRIIFWAVGREVFQVHLLILHLNLKVLEVAPFGKNLHSLDVFDGSKLLSIVFVTTKGIKINLLSKTFVLLLHDLKNCNDLLAVKYFIIIHTGNRVEYSPHDLRIINSA